MLKWTKQAIQKIVRVSSFRATIVVVENNKYYLFWLWISSLWYPECNAHACLVLRYFFTLSHKRNDIIKKMLFNINWTFFSTHFSEIQSNLGSRTPRIMNNSVYEQIFRTKSVSDDVLCLELRTRKPSTSWNDKLGKSPSKQ